MLVLVMMEDSVYTLVMLYVTQNDTSEVTSVGFSMSLIPALVYANDEDDNPITFYSASTTKDFFQCRQSTRVL